LISNGAGRGPFIVSALTASRPCQVAWDAFRQRPRHSRPEPSLNYPRLVCGLSTGRTAAIRPS